MKPAASLALALLLAATARAQSPATFTDPANLRGERVSPLTGRELPIDQSEAQGGHGLQQLLRKLNTRASLLLIVAHPDDEDGGMLTLYSRGLGARVADLSLNRGEGGQNAMTADFEDALGLLRTQELLSADRYFDADQFFGTEVDFGFSKTKEESFAKWTHERVLYDAVRAVRLYRPLVIASVFLGGVTDGHGQHQVAGEIAQEVFTAAANPKVFPELTAEGILPWQPLKVYARVPEQAITARGLFDYATGQYTPARFTNYVTGEVTVTVPSADVIVHEGTTDPLLTYAAANPADVHNPSASPDAPLSYVQFARIGLGLQRSQVGPGMRLPPPGAFDIAYHLYASRICAQPPAPAKKAIILSAAKDPCIPPAPALPPNATQPDPTFFDGIDTSITGIGTLAPHLPMSFKQGLEDLSSSISRASVVFEGMHSQQSQQNELRTNLIASSLADALKRADALISGVESASLPLDEKANILHELRIKQVQLNDALVLALGLSVDATAQSNDLVENSSPELKTALTESSTETVKFKSMDIYGAGWGRGQSFHDSITPELSSSKPLERTWQVPNDRMIQITRPYFYRDNIEQPVYKLRDPALRNAPQTPAPLTAWATINYQGTKITLGRIVHDGPQPISIVPPVSIANSPGATVLPNSQPTAELTATLRTGATTSANINVQSPHGWTIEAKAVPSPAADTTHSIHFFLHPTAPVAEPQLFHVTAETPDHHTYTEGYRPVGYPGLPYTNYYTPATTRIVPVDLNLPIHKKIAYLPGTGDAVPEALSSIGLTPTILTVADLTPDKLKTFDTIILGVRTYNAHPDLHGAPTQTLLDYAKNGGNVLVQYQTAEFTAADAPYPLTLGYAAEKVVDETDPVQLLTPAGPLLSIPNKITPADFNNWIEERGHGFLRTWDPHYTALTETHDPGQDPQRGGLITTPLGKGRWTYCAFALYRQLPEAVPGAYRLFVNLLNP